MNIKNKIIAHISKVVFLVGTSFLLVVTSVQSAGITFNITSPLAVTSLEDFLLAVLNIIIIVATPIIVLAIIYSGFLYVTARGNITQTQTATRALTYSIIGGILIIGAVALSAVIGNLVASFSP